MKKNAIPLAVRQLWELPLTTPHILQIYQNVPLRDLTHTSPEKPEIDPSLDDLCFLYVLCHDAAVYMAVADWNTFGFMGRQSLRMDTASIPGLLVVKDLQSLRYQDTIRQNLMNHVDSLSHSLWQYHPQIISGQDAESLRRKRLAEPWNTPDIRGCRPTDYGRSMGLSTCYRMSVNGKITCAPACTKERLASLKKPWVNPEGKPGQKIPLKQRLQRLSQGMASTPDHGARVARQMADITLEDYTSALPDDLEILLNGLGLDKFCTLWEAAEIINCQLHSSDSEEIEKGRDMLWYLSRSIELAYQKGVNRR